MRGGRVKHSEHWFRAPPSALCVVKCPIVQVGTEHVVPLIEIYRLYNRLQQCRYSSPAKTEIQLHPRLGWYGSVPIARSWLPGRSSYPHPLLSWFVDSIYFAVLCIVVTGAGCKHCMQKSEPWLSWLTSTYIYMLTCWLSDQRSENLLCSMDSQSSLIRISLNEVPAYVCRSHFHCFLVHVPSLYHAKARLGLNSASTVSSTWSQPSIGRSCLMAMESTNVHQCHLRNKCSKLLNYCYPPILSYTPIYPYPKF